jgi:bacterial/archaeal transporter family protein
MKVNGSRTTVGVAFRCHGGGGRMRGRIGRKRALFFLYALIAMVCWGVAPIFAKAGLREANPLMGLAIRTSVTAVLVTGWLFVRGSVTQVQAVSWSSFVFLAIEAIFATLIGDWAYYSAIKKGSVALLEVIMACSPIITILLIGEPFTFLKIVGILLIVAGIAIVI